MPISGNELLIILLLAAFLIGPERLPKYADQVGQFVRVVRRMVTDAKVQLKEELGPEVGDVDWSQFDPRRYDPRRIVREALLEEPGPAAPAAPGSRAGVLAGEAPSSGDRAVPGAPAPFDDEAT